MTPSNEPGRAHAASWAAPALWILLLAAVAGCSAFDGQRVRQEDADRFQAASREATERELAGRKSLSLDDCMAIALRNNLQLRMAEINARMAHLDRLASFAMFLPVVEASGSLTTMDRQPMIRAGQDPSGNAVYMAMQDKNQETAALQIQLPIFRPSSWFLYSASKRGEEIASILKDYTRQRICLEVTAQYFQCLSFREMAQSARSRVATARQLQTEVEARAAEGLIDGVQVEEVRTLHLARQVELERLDRAEATARADLMVLLGLSPLTPCALGEATPIKAPAGDVAELVTRALLSHPQLQIADRSVAISHEGVKASVANFLPSIFATGAVTASSDSYLKYGTSWMAGLTGVMTVFNGFANVQQYRLAKEREKETWLRREEACLAVMLQVVRAQASLRDAEQDEQLARKYLDVTSGRLRAIDAKWREGLASATELLAATAARDESVAGHTVARFRREVCTAALLHSMGQTGFMPAGGRPADSKR